MSHVRTKLACGEGHRHREYGDMNSDRLPPVSYCKEQIYQPEESRECGGIGWEMDGSVPLRRCC
jgi:hypothetical protein